MICVIFYCTGRGATRIKFWTFSFYQWSMQLWVIFPTFVICWWSETFSQHFKLGRTSHFRGIWIIRINQERNKINFSKYYIMTFNRSKKSFFNNYYLNSYLILRVESIKDLWFTWFSPKLGQKYAWNYHLILSSKNILFRTNYFILYLDLWIVLVLIYCFTYFQPVEGKNAVSDKNLLWPSAAVIYKTTDDVGKFYIQIHMTEY